VQVRPQELASHLGRTLLPVYLVSGDEPLQTLEAADAIREAARARGHGTRELFDVGKGFDWGRLAAEAGNLSLFGDRRIIELRLASSRPASTGQTWTTAPALSIALNQAARVWSRSSLGITTSSTASSGGCAA
jgi:DNA polymerase III delta subunit